MQEGLANVCLVGRSVTMVCAKIEGNIPKKRGAAAGYDKALSRFMDKVGADHQTWQPPTLETWQRRHTGYEGQSAGSITKHIRCRCPQNVTAALQVLAAVVRHVNWDVTKCLVIAGPGYAKDKFKEHLELEAVRQDIK